MSDENGDKPREPKHTSPAPIVSQPAITAPPSARKKRDVGDVTSAVAFPTAITVAAGIPALLDLTMAVRLILVVLIFVVLLAFMGRFPGALRTSTNFIVNSIWRLVVPVVIAGVIIIAILTGKPLYTPLDNALAQIAIGALAYNVGSIWLGYRMARLNHNPSAPVRPPLGVLTYVALTQTLGATFGAYVFASDDPYFIKLLLNTLVLVGIGIGALMTGVEKLAISTVALDRINNSAPPGSAPDSPPTGSPV